jgi:hypothetical protein
MRDRPSRRQDGLRGNMVSANESGFYLRETSLLLHNILSTGGVVTAGDVGQRTNLDVSRLLKGYCVLQVGAGYPIYPAPVRDSTKSGLGSAANRYLNYPVESVCVNTGGSYPDVKTSSLSMPEKSVGGVIVVGARESRVQGEAAIRSLETTPKRRGREIEIITIFDNLGSVEVGFLSPRCRGDAHSPQR